MDFLDSPSSDLVSSDLFDHQFRYNGGPILKLDDEERLPIVPTRSAGAGEWCEPHRERAGVDVAAVWIVNGEAFCAGCHRGQHVYDFEKEGDHGDEREAASQRAYHIRNRERILAKRRATRRATAPPEKIAKPFAPRSCVRCAVLFTPIGPRGTRRYCSKDCQAAQVREQNRTKMRNWNLRKRLRLMDIGAIADKTREMAQGITLEAF